MRKKTSFYIASAALAATIFVGAAEAKADAPTAEAGYHFLEKYETVQTIDVSQQNGDVRIISFSLPVDETSIHDNQNIQLYDVTSNERVNVRSTVVNTKDTYEVHVALADGETYTEGHEYRLLVGHRDYPIRNVATKASALQKAVQFNFQAVNVPTDKTEAAGTLTAFTEKTMQLDGKTYNVSSEVAAFMKANEAALQNSYMQARIVDGNVVGFHDVTLSAPHTTFSGATAPSVLMNASITVDAEHVTIDRAQIENLFVTSNVQQAVNVQNTTVQGRVEVIEGRQVQAVVEEQHATTLVIRFSNSVVVEMLIARVDVKSEISGTSRFELISVTADTNIWSDEEVVLPRLSIERGVTNIELNASIAQVDIKTTNNLKVTGSGNFEAVNIESEKKIELATTGTIEKVAVKNELATMTIGADVTIEKVTIPDTLEPQQVIDNYDEVKEQLNEKIDKEDLAQYIAAKMMPVDQHDFFATISVVGAPSNANISYQHYSYGEQVVPNVGDVLQGANAWKKDEAIVHYLDRQYYVFVTDEEGVITQRFDIYDRPYNTYVTHAQTDETLKLSVSGYVSSYTPAQYFEGVYITDGKQSEVVDLTNTVFQYDDNNVPYIEIDVTKYEEPVSYYIDSVGISYVHSGIHTIESETAAYMKALHDFANNDRHRETFLWLLEWTNYIEAPYTAPNGETYMMHVSAISKAPSVQQQYVEAFQQQAFSTVADVQQTVQAINAQHASTIQSFNGIVDDIQAFYGDDGFKEHVTLAQIEAVKDKIEALSIPAADKEELLNRQYSLYYGHVQRYYDELYALYDNSGDVKDDVTYAQIDAIIANIMNELDETHPERQNLLSSFEWLKQRVLLQPFIKLENTTARYESERLQANTTLAQIDAAYEQAMANAKTDEQRTNVDSYYSQMRYMYVLKEVARLATTPDVSNGNLFTFKDGVTLAQVNAIFEEVNMQQTDEHYYAMEWMHVMAKTAHALSPLLPYVSYVDGVYTLREQATIDDVMQIYNEIDATITDDAVRSRAEDVLVSIALQPLHALYDDAFLRPDVTLAQIEAAYAQMNEATVVPFVQQQVQERYTEVLYQWANAQAQAYRVISADSPHTITRLLDGTTQQQIEAVFKDIDVSDLSHTYGAYLLNTLHESLTASVELHDALQLLQDDYWHAARDAQLRDGVTTKEYIDTLTALQQQSLSEAALSWIHNEMNTYALQPFTALLNESDNFYYGDDLQLKADVTLAQIDAAYAQVKDMLDETEARYMYERYVYYYYAKEVANLYEGHIHKSDALQVIKLGTTAEDVHAIFASASEEQQTAEVLRLQEAALIAVELQHVLALFEVAINGNNTLTQLKDGVTRAQLKQAYEAATATVQRDAAHMQLERLLNRVVATAFNALYSDSYYNDATALRADRTLADVDAIYTQLVAELGEHAAITYNYEQFAYYYYARETARITGDNNAFYGGFTFTTEQREALLQLLGQANYAASTTHYGQMIFDLQLQLDASRFEPFDYKTLATYEAVQPFITEIQEGDELSFGLAHDVDAQSLSAFIAELKTTLQQSPRNSVELQRLLGICEIVLQDKAESSAYMQLMTALQPYEAFANVAAFIDETAYSYTFLDDIDVAQLQQLVTEVTAAIDNGTVTDETQHITLQLFVEMAQHYITTRQQTAFIPTMFS